LYKVVGEAVHAFVGRQSMNELKRLLGVLKAARREQLQREEVVARVKESTPELSRVADCLPRTRIELYVFLSVIIGLLAILLNLIPSGKSDFSKDEIIQHVETAIERSYGSTAKHPTDKPAKEPSSGLGDRGKRGQ